MLVHLSSDDERILAGMVQADPQHAKQLVRRCCSEFGAPTAPTRQQWPQAHWEVGVPGGGCVSKGGLPVSPCP
jgi:hypothetical protein